MHVPGYVPWELNLQIHGSAGATGVQPQEILQERRSDTNPWFESDALKVGACFVSAQAFGRSPGLISSLQNPIWCLFDHSQVLFHILLAFSDSRSHIVSPVTD